MERKETKDIIVSFSLVSGKWGKMIESSRRVYDPKGIAPTIHTCGGGNTEIKVVVNERRQNSENSADFELREMAEEI